MSIGLCVFLSYVVISLTDKLDGYLARSRNEVTVSESFLILSPISLLLLALLYCLRAYGVSVGSSGNCGA